MVTQTVGSGGTQQRRKTCSHSGFVKGWREPMQWESAPLDVGHLEEREAEVSDRQDSGTLRSASNASSCTVHAVDQNAPFVYDPMPAGDPREPVLYIRCTDGAGLGPLERDAVGDSWSPKIAAVLTKSLEGGERWARLQLSKFGVSTPRSAACAAKDD